MMGDRRIVHILRIVTVTINNHHLRQNLQLTHIEHRAQRVNFIHPRLELGFSAHHDTKIALLGRPEGIQRSGISFATKRAAPMRSLSTTITPRPRASGSAATVTASSRFIGPSALIAVAGRIAAVKTTGLLLFTVRLRKYGVSSSVSVPWVITTPSTSSRPIAHLPASRAGE